MSTNEPRPIGSLNAEEAEIMVNKFSCTTPADTQPSDTPRTDDEEHECELVCPSRFADFARTLERELQSAQQQLAAAREDSELWEFIESQSTRGLLWEARQSSTGRGYRLHQHGPFNEWGFKTAREAVAFAMHAARKEGAKQ